MKIGIYNKFFYLFGGGEKHSGVIAEILSRDHEVDLMTHKYVSKDLLESRLNVDLRDAKIRILPEDYNEYRISKITSEYDLFINSTNLSTLQSRAKKSLLLVFFPMKFNLKNRLWKCFDGLEGNERSLRQLSIFYENSIMRRFDFLRTYDVVCANSEFTGNWIRRYWNVDSEVLYPPIDTEFFKPMEKKNMIISVGRFFEGFHNKKHIPMIRIFKSMYDGGLDRWQYHLAGSTHNERIHLNYLEKVKREAKGYPIFIHTDIAFKELRQLYGEAKIFWHGAGFGEDEKKEPDKFEHFGMTTVEAMSSGCVPVVIGKAGQLEIIRDGFNGYLWKSLDELEEKTKKVIEDEGLQERIRINALRSCEKFNKINFEKRLKSILTAHQIL